MQQKKPPNGKLVEQNMSPDIEQALPHACLIPKSTSMVQLFIFKLSSHVADIEDTRHHTL